MIEVEMYVFEKLFVTYSLVLDCCTVYYDCIYTLEHYYERSGLEMASIHFHEKGFYIVFISFSAVARSFLNNTE